MQSTKSRNGSSSTNQNKNLKNRGSKTTERTPARSPMSEKKQPSKVSELESQLTQFQEELKRAKDQLSSLDVQKKRAQQEAEEARKQVSFLSAKLEESQQQLIELSDSEDARLQELRKLSQERDKSWQSELEALQKQHAADTTALSSAMSEIQRLKKQLEITTESEAMQSRHAESAHEDIQSLRIELSETLELVEKMKHQLTDVKESEARAFEMMSETQMQLEVAKATAETIRADSLEVKEGYNSLASELEQSKAQVSTLERLVCKLQEDLASSNANNSTNSSCSDVVVKDEETDKLKMEIQKVKAALEASEVRYQNEYIQSTLQIRNAYEAVERAKIESSFKEAALIEELKRGKEAIEELKSDLASKHNILKQISDENEELKKSGEELADLKSALLDKETQLQTLVEENEVLRTEISETKIAEELDMTQMEKAELEAELRRLKVQSDQWRKAAEAAAAMLSPDCDTKVIDKTIVVDTIGMKMDSPFSDNMDDDSPKKKNANMLKKIGGLWKKGQK